MLGRNCKLLPYMIQSGALPLQGLHDAIDLSVTHPTWQRTRPDDPNDEHTG